MDETSLKIAQDDELCSAEIRTRHLDSLNFHTSLSDLFGSTTGAEQPEAEFLQAFGEGQEASLVIDG